MNEIELHSKLLKTKAILNKVNDTSYAYSQLSKRFPYQSAISKEEVKNILDSYVELITDLVDFLETTEFAK